MDLSFPVDISVPTTTPAPTSAEGSGRPFDDLLDDGLAQALAAASGVTALAPASLPDTLPAVDPDAPAGIEALAATGATAEHLTGSPTSLTLDGTGTVPADLGTTLPTPSAETAAPIDDQVTMITAAGTLSTGDAITTAGVTTAGVTTAGATTAGATTADDATASTVTSPSPPSPTAATNQAHAVAAQAPRALDPARVAITRQGGRSPELPSASDSASDVITDVTSDVATGGVRNTTTAVSDGASQVGREVTVEPAPAAGPLPAEATARSGNGEAAPDSTDASNSGVDTSRSGAGTFATDKVRYLRDLAPAREIQRLAIDLDDARVAVRFADGAATVDVMSDPSSRLDSGWVSNVERTLRQLDRPLDPPSAGDPSQRQDDRGRQDPDSRHQDRHHDPHRDPHDNARHPSIDDERIRRWQDATRALMTTPTTRN